MKLYLCLILTIKVLNFLNTECIYKVELWVDVQFSTFLAQHPTFPFHLNEETKIFVINQSSCTLEVKRHYMIICFIQDINHSINKSISKFPLPNFYVFLWEWCPDETKILLHEFSFHNLSLIYTRREDRGIWRQLCYFLQILYTNIQIPDRNIKIHYEPHTNIHPIMLAKYLFSE